MSAWRGTPLPRTLLAEYRESFQFLGQLETTPCSFWASRRAFSSLRPVVCRGPSTDCRTDFAGARLPETETPPKHTETLSLMPAAMMGRRRLLLFVQFDQVRLRLFAVCRLHAQTLTQRRYRPISALSYRQYTLSGARSHGLFDSQQHGEPLPRFLPRRIRKATQGTLSRPESKGSYFFLG